MLQAGKYRYRYAASAAEYCLYAVRLRVTPVRTILLNVGQNALHTAVSRVAVEAVARTL